MGLAVRPKAMVKFIESNGFRFVSQRGSHRKFTDGAFVTTVPMHNDDLDAGTLRAILKDTGLTRRQLEGYLGR